MSELKAKFEELRKSSLVYAAIQLQDLLEGYLKDVEHVDRVSVRPKSVKSFLDKAAKSKDDGSPKYVDPLNQIQDQVGARVIVFYLSDIKVVQEAVHKYFKAIEILDKVPESEWEFGYFGTHYILALPNDVWPDGKRPDGAPEFFELQIKTLYQHAWSEASHDLGYKGVELLTDEVRKLAFTSAQSWGADKIFEELFQSISTRIPEIE